MNPKEYVDIIEIHTKKYVEYRTKEGVFLSRRLKPDLYKREPIKKQTEADKVRREGRD